MRYLCGKAPKKKHRRWLKVQPKKQHMGQSVDCMMREIKEADEKNNTDMTMKLQKTMAADQRAFLIRMGTLVSRCLPSFQSSIDLGFHICHIPC